MLRHSLICGSLCRNSRERSRRVGGCWQIFTAHLDNRRNVGGERLYPRLPPPTTFLLPLCVWYRCVFQLFPGSVWGRCGLSACQIKASVSQLFLKCHTLCFHWGGVQNACDLLSASFSSISARSRGGRGGKRGFRRGQGAGSHRGKSRVRG